MKPFIDSLWLKAFWNGIGRRYMQSKKKRKNVKQIPFRLWDFPPFLWSIICLVLWHFRWGRFHIIVTAASLFLWGFKWQRLLAWEIGCLHYWLGHIVLTEIVVKILGWFACVTLAWVLSINSGEILLLQRVRHHVSVCSFRLSVTLPAAADYKPYRNQETVYCLFLCLWPWIVFGCFGLCLL